MRTIEVSDDVAVLLQKYAAVDQVLTKADLLYAIKKIEDDAKNQEESSPKLCLRANAQQAKVKLLELFLISQGQETDIGRVLNLCKAVVSQTLCLIKASNAENKNNTTFIFCRVLEAFIDLDNQFTLTPAMRKHTIAHPKVYLTLEKSKRNYQIKGDIYHNISGKKQLGLALKDILWGATEAAHNNKSITKDEKLAIYHLISYLLVLINLKNIEAILSDHLEFIDGLFQLIENNVSKFKKITQRHYMDAFAEGRYPFPLGSSENYLITVTPTMVKELKLSWFQSDEFVNAHQGTRMTYINVTNRSDNLFISMRIKTIVDENRDAVLKCIANIASIWHLMPND